MALAYNNIRRLDNPFIFEQPFQSHIFSKAHVANGEVCITAHIVGKGRLRSVKNIIPSCSETTLKSIVQFPFRNILSIYEPDLFKVANGNQSSRDGSPSFIEIDRTVIETGKRLSPHHPKDHKPMHCSNLKYTEQAATADCY